MNTNQIDHDSCGLCPICAPEPAEVRECDNCGEVRKMSEDPEEWTCEECFAGRCNADAATAAGQAAARACFYST